VLRVRHTILAMRVLRAGLGVLLALGAVFVGCSGSGTGSVSGGICQRAVAKFRECRFTATANALTTECEEPEDAEEQCEANCILDQTCTALVGLYCRSDPSGFTSCITSCEPPPFTCANGEKVDANDKCDGFADCSDSSDEAGCPTFACADGQTIPLDNQCDAWPDCSDGSDEQGCTNLFDCGDGEKVLLEDKCDGNNDCVSGADEQGCPPKPDVEDALAQDCQSL
jgi:hypothetical protein